MAKRKDVHFLLLADDNSLHKIVSDRKCHNITFIKFPPANPLTAHPTSFFTRLIRGDLFNRFWDRVFCDLDERYFFDSLLNRSTSFRNL